MRLPALNSKLLGVSSLFAKRSSVCLADPPLLLDAGASGVSLLLVIPSGHSQPPVRSANLARSRSVDMPAYARCEAAVYFADPVFLPIRYSFDPAPQCQGLKTLNFDVPRGVPNGEAQVVWCVSHR